MSKGNGAAAPARPVVITGGAGFVGANLAHRLLRAGRVVRMIDNFGAQVAVTTSLVDPIEDFDVNARGTVNVLEAVRALPRPPAMIFTSTNKVYGNLEDVALALRNDRYATLNDAVRAHGVREARSLRFHSPYGCSKGAADQYVLEGRAIMLHGDGKQVRDVLFVDDLVDAFLLAESDVDALACRAFNIGGGAANATSLLDMMAMIGELHGTRPALHFDAWCTGDQRYHVSHTRTFQNATGWAPRHSVHEGVEQRYPWLVNSRARSLGAMLATTSHEITR